MKWKWFLLVVVATLAAGGLILAYLQMSRKRGREAEREKPVAAESQVTRGPAGEVSIRLELEAQKRLALQIQVLSAFKFTPELVAYGHVLDPAPLASLLGERLAFQATAKASTQEFVRLKTLAAQDNASIRALQAAEASARRDEVQVRALHQRLLTSWGPAIAAGTNLEALVQSLVALKSALVRIDLAAGENLPEPAVTATLSSLTEDTNSIEARYLGPAPDTDPQTQGQGLLFLVADNDSRLVPGAAVTARMPLLGKAGQNLPTLKGVAIPDSAIVRFNGRAWFFVQTSENTFARREIALNHETANGWFTSEAAAPNERVVVLGAQMLLSEEQKHQIRMMD